jgi:hypothetical protein
MNRRKAGGKVARGRSKMPHKGIEMIREQQPAISLFSIGMIGLGTLSAFYRDFAYDWQPIPAFHPGRDVLAVACGLSFKTAPDSVIHAARSDQAGPIGKAATTRKDELRIGKPNRCGIN